MPVGRLIRRILDIQGLTVGDRQHHAVEAVHRSPLDKSTGWATEQGTDTCGLERDRQVRRSSIPHAMIFPARIIIQHIIDKNNADLRAGERGAGSAFSGSPPATWQAIPGSCQSRGLLEAAR
jgi:hypothetical protein